jgi:hypothetical protein
MSNKISNKNSLRVSHRYTRLPGSSFNFFASSVVVGMTDNPAFPNPIVPLDLLSALQMDFEQKNLVSKLGGGVAMALKNEARAALTDALRRQGAYVQGVAQNLSTLLSSGYVAASRNNAQTRLLKPWVRKILNNGPGQLLLRITPVANARSYHIQVQEGDGPWQEAGFSNQARRIMVANLTPGTLYNIRVRALGGSTGFSDWSLVTSARSL